jgi:hypothetical protein
VGTACSWAYDWRGSSLNFQIALFRDDSVLKKMVKTRAFCLPSALRNTFPVEVLHDVTE